MTKNERRLNLVLTPRLVEEVENLKEFYGFSSRQEAFRYLAMRGLETVKTNQSIREQVDVIKLMVEAIEEGAAEGSRRGGVSSSTATEGQKCPPEPLLPFPTEDEK